MYLVKINKELYVDRDRVLAVYESDTPNIKRTTIQLKGFRVYVDDVTVDEVYSALREGCYYRPVVTESGEEELCEIHGGPRSSYTHESFCSKSPIMAPIGILRNYKLYQGDENQ